MDSVIKRYQALLFGHAAIVAIIGLVSGFFLMYSVLGRVELWPLFSTDMTVPGEIRAWRAAHVGCVMNALLCGMGAMALPFVNGKKSCVFVVYGLIFTAWANSVFYVFGRTHGLTGGQVQGLGQGNAFDVIAYIPAATATTITIVCMALVAIGAFGSAKRSAAAP